MNNDRDIISNVKDRPISSFNATAAIERAKREARIRKRRLKEIRTRVALVITTAVVSVGGTLITKNFKDKQSTRNAYENSKSNYEYISEVKDINMYKNADLIKQYTETQMDALRILIAQLRGIPVDAYDTVVFGDVHYEKADKEYTGTLYWYGNKTKKSDLDELQNDIFEQAIKVSKIKQNADSYYFPTVQKECDADLAKLIERVKEAEEHKQK